MLPGLPSSKRKARPQGRAFSFPCAPSQPYVRAWHGSCDFPASSSRRTPDAAVPPAACRLRRVPLRPLYLRHAPAGHCHQHDGRGRFAACAWRVALVVAAAGIHRAGLAVAGLAHFPPQHRAGDCRIPQPGDRRRRGRVLDRHHALRPAAFGAAGLGDGDGPHRGRRLAAGTPFDGSDGGGVPGRGGAERLRLRAAHRIHHHALVHAVPGAVPAGDRRVGADVLRQDPRAEAGTGEGGAIDAETGLATRQQWLALVAGQMRRFERYGAASSLLMIDIDGFKRVNDSQGHVAGDQVIREVSAQLLAGLRSADAAGRYGGDEFGVLLPGTERQAAQEVAERLRQRVAAQVAAAGIPVTVSIGVAEIEDGMFTPEDWTAAADEALYRAKAAGRNRVSF
ncbi:hypothetical protein CSC64_08125 [Pseudoxanthomonas koreensis]|nr:hypothetical protein CSC64_08125 [Pseudoxanthomonas koreensis]